MNCFCRNWADKNAVPILLDLDDLTFDVKCFEPGQWVTGFSPSSGQEYGKSCALSIPGIAGC